MVGGSTLGNPEGAKSGREIGRKKWGAPPQGCGSESHSLEVQAAEATTEGPGEAESRARMSTVHHLFPFHSSNHVKCISARST